MAFYRPPNTKKRNFRDPTYIKMHFGEMTPTYKKLHFLDRHIPKMAKKLTPSYKNVKNWSKMAKHVDLHTKMTKAIF